MAQHDRRQHSPAAERNRGPIRQLLVDLLPPVGAMLEIASGTGQHAVHFAAALPGWRWQPTDRDADARESIAAWAAHAGIVNLEAPLALDVTADEWPVGRYDAMFCANMIHIAPWAACVGLFTGAARHLRDHCALILYGPFIIDGEPTAASNLAFDADLRSRNAEWGLRELAGVEAVAADNRFALEQRFAMPANNQLIVFRPRRAA